MHVEPRSFFFARHGESEYNADGKIGGDSGLSAMGEQFALALGEWVRAHMLVDAEGKPRPARLWTSSMKRCIQTARHIPHERCEYNGAEWVQMRPKIFKNLDELFAGECDGMTYAEIAAAFPEEEEARSRNKFEYRRAADC
eukprot:6197850-Pleurochrysis_carterae.AAC.1